jgi:aryl carrier-like protein
MPFEDWQAVVNPKVLGTWNIHEALKSSQLDFFVLFSSGSGIIGQSGQANYASGNTFNDAFVQYRQSLHLPASVLDIGVVEDIGYVSANPQLLETLRAAGFYLLSETDLLDGLQLIISRSTLPAVLQNSTTKPTRTNPFMNPAQVVMGMRSTLPLGDPDNRCSWKRDPRMAAYRDSGSLLSASQRSAGTNEALQNFVAAAAVDASRLCADEAVAFLTEQIRARVLGFLMKEQLDASATLNDVGLDSLVAIELRTWWRQNLRIDVSVLELLNASVGQLGRLAAERLREKLEGKTEESAGGGSDGAVRETEKRKMSGADYLSMKAP